MFVFAMCLYVQIKHLQNYVKVWNTNVNDVEKNIFQGYIALIEKQTNFYMCDYVWPKSRRKRLFVAISWLFVSISYNKTQLKSITMKVNDKKCQKHKIITTFYRLSLKQATICCR